MLFHVFFTKFHIDFMLISCFFHAHFMFFSQNFTLISCSFHVFFTKFHTHFMLISCFFHAIFAVLGAILNKNAVFWLKSAVNVPFLLQIEAECSKIASSLRSPFQGVKMQIRFPDPALSFAMSVPKWLFPYRFVRR